MANLPAPVLDELLQLWRAMTGMGKHVSDSLAIQRLILAEVARIDARLNALEGQTGEVAGLVKSVEEIRERLTDVETDAQRTKDLLDLEDIEKRLAAAGIRPED